MSTELIDFSTTVECIVAESEKLPDLKDCKDGAGEM
ncbi:hypothetical protein GcM1_143001 [Golovinomyces cichoracearum]|uniref:Uncharacterized protein n=1 Tax=Golovinomyces cichoracearum TaxID=62708 RepID=A0A420JBI9_9PEZI|nr:hypothetical protein GcM1_143001 [Golovinomyces cichoracearum]